MADLVAGAAASADRGAPTAGRGGRGARSETIPVVLGLLAGLLYNSWPLGFVLDRPALRGTYVSVLEAPGRPDAGVFVACDLAAGALALVAGLLVRRRPLVAAGLVMFGVGNVLDGCIPIEASCADSVASCGTGLAQVLAPHTLASCLSVAGLGLALWSLRDHSHWMRAVIALLAFSALFLLVSVLTARWVMVSQMAFLLASGVTLGAAPTACVTARDPGRRALERV